MKLHIITIALDAMPFIAMHLPVFRALPFPWTWTIIEGVAAPSFCTKWCNEIAPRLSKDGTTQYLDSIRFDTRVRVFRSELWDGKVSMVNKALKHIHEPGLLLQVDADELWTADQLIKLHDLFTRDPSRNMAWFYCRYFLGPDIVITSRSNYGNNVEYEWQRAWRFEPGMKFRTHEPPVIEDIRPKPFTHAETERAGLVFDHMAYVTEAQLRFKEHYYGYPDALAHWRKLQHNTKWPARVRDFLPWVEDKAVAERIRT
jgi:hypothetical protein